MELPDIVSEASPPVRLPRAAWEFLWILVGAVLLCLATEAVCRHLPAYAGHIYRYPLRVEYIPFADLAMFQSKFSHLHTEAFFSPDDGIFAYPATMAWFYAAVYAFQPHIIAAYLTFSLALLGTGAAFFSRALHTRGVPWLTAASFTVVALACSYPVSFMLSQGNLEAPLWAIMTLGVVLYLRRWVFWAAVCFGIAASLKIYPVIFLFLMLLRREVRQALVGTVSLLASSVAGLMFVGPTIGKAFYGIRHGLDHFRSDYMQKFRTETGIDHSLFGLVKTVFRAKAEHGNTTEWLRVYLVVATCLILVLFLYRVLRLPLLNQICFCLIVCVLFTPTSFEYTLIQVLTLSALLLLVGVDTAQTRESARSLRMSLPLCALTLGFFPELIFHQLQFSGPLKCLFLCALLVLILRFPLPWAERRVLAQTCETSLWGRSRA